MKAHHKKWCCITSCYLVMISLQHSACSRIMKTEKLVVSRGHPHLVLSPRHRKCLFSLKTKNKTHTHWCLSFASHDAPKMSDTKRRNIGLLKILLLQNRLVIYRLLFSTYCFFPEIHLFFFFLSIFPSMRIVVAAHEGAKSVWSHNGVIKGKFTLTNSSSGQTGHTQTTMHSAGGGGAWNEPCKRTKLACTFHTHATTVIPLIGLCSHSSWPRLQAQQDWNATYCCKGPSSNNRGPGTVSTTIPPCWSVPKHQCCWLLGRPAECI